MTTTSSKYLGETILAKYRLEQVLDITPEATVFRGVHLAMKRPVEVTLVELTPEVESVQRAGFEKRAAAASQLSHPGVARIYDFGRHDNEFLYRVEELLEGTTLFELTSTAKAPDLPTLLEIASRLTEILDEVHQESLYHLQLTPSEIVFLGDDVTADTLRIQHFAGAPWGTSPEAPAYAAPEQFTGDDVGAQADVYAVGLVLWYALVGAPAVMGSAQLARHAHLSSAPWRLPPNIDCSPELAEVVHKAIAKPKAQRYASMRDFHRALRRGDCAR